MLAAMFSLYCCYLNFMQVEPSSMIIKPLIDNIMLFALVFTPSIVGSLVRSYGNLKLNHCLLKVFYLYVKLL